MRKREYLEELRRSKAILASLASDHLLGLKMIDGYWRCDYCGCLSFKCESGGALRKGSWQVCHHAGCRIWDAHFFLANPEVGD